MGRCPGAPAQMQRWRRLMESRHPIERAFSLEAFRPACPACCGGQGAHKCGLPGNRADRQAEEDGLAPAPAGQTPILADPDRLQVVREALREALDDPDAELLEPQEEDDTTGDAWEGVQPPPEQPEDGEVWEDAPTHPIPEISIHR